MSYQPSQHAWFRRRSRTRWQTRIDAHMLVVMPETARCSFCDKSQQQVKHLIAGPSAFICDECVELCQEIVEAEVQVQEDTGATSPWLIRTE